MSCKAKNYLVYDKGLTADQISQVEAALGYAWTPEELAGKVVWLEQNFIEDIGVETWSDRTTNANDFTQTTDANQPTLNADGMTVEFDGIADYLSCPVDSSNWQDLTYYEAHFVAKLDGSGNLINWTDANQPYNVNTVRLYFSAGNINSYAYENGTTSIRTYSSAYTVGEWHYIRIVWNGGNDQKVYVDNVEMVGTGGTFNGYFVGHLANKALVDTHSLGAMIGTVPYYVDANMRFYLGVSQSTTQADRDALFNYVKKQGYLDS